MDKDHIVISTPTPEETPRVVDFIVKGRTEIFPMLNEASHAQTANRELASFQQTYLDHPDRALFVARASGILIATITYVAYDYRFPQLSLGHERVVEVVRLYVEPSWRRAGMASRLFGAVANKARQVGIEMLYLHTHPFLPGAIGFWERQGFEVDDDPIWRKQASLATTIHSFIRYFRIILTNPDNLA